MTIRSASEWIALRLSDDLDAQRRSAREDASLEVWLSVIETPSMRFWVAQNKTVPMQVLRLLAEDEDPKVRLMVAAKRKLGVETLMGLAADSDEGVRRCVAHNPSTPREVLKRLSDDSVGDIRDRALQRLSEWEG